jgi:signal transduction histidine kinase
MTLGGGFGWWLGAHHGIMTAFILSIVGTGVGLYIGKRVADMLGG